jgi:hypothetical protein
MGFVPRVLMLLFIQTIVACSQSANPGDPFRTPAVPADSMTLPDGTDKAVTTPLRELAGTVGFDTDEGGCWYLEARDGTRYEVILPDGWVVEPRATRLIGPDGQAVSTGAVITVRGTIATDVSSTCQIGPIFRATEVANVTGS